MFYKLLNILLPAHCVTVNYNEKRHMMKGLDEINPQKKPQRAHQREKYLRCSPRKMLGTILKMDEGTTSTNRPENK